jgi:hypothetical protein
MTVTNCTNCVCTPNLVLNGCVLNGSFTGAGCPNFTYQLQYSATGTGWSIAASGTASNGGTFSHTPTANGFYRLVIVSKRLYTPANSRRECKLRRELWMYGRDSYL